MMYFSRLIALGFWTLIFIATLAASASVASWYVLIYEKWMVGPGMVPILGTLGIVGFLFAIKYVILAVVVLLVGLAGKWVAR